MPCVSHWGRGSEMCVKGGLAQYVHISCISCCSARHIRHYFRVARISDTNVVCDLKLSPMLDNVIVV